MKIEMWVYLEDDCCGSVVPHVFKTQEDAQQQAEWDEEDTGQRLPDTNIFRWVIDTDFFKKVAEV